MLFIRDTADNRSKLRCRQLTDPFEGALVLHSDGQYLPSLRLYDTPTARKALSVLDY